MTLLNTEEYGRREIYKHFHHHQGTVGKDKARQLEKQLSEASSKNGSIIWMIISIISIIALVIVLLFK